MLRNAMFSSIIFGPRDWTARSEDVNWTSLQQPGVHDNHAVPSAGSVSPALNRGARQAAPVATSYNCQAFGGKSAVPTNAFHNLRS